MTTTKFFIMEERENITKSINTQPNESRGRKQVHKLGKGQTSKQRASPAVMCQIR